MDPEDAGAIEALRAQVRRHVERIRIMPTITPKTAYEEEALHVEMRALLEEVAQGRAQLKAAQKAIDDQRKDESDLSEESESSESSVEDDAAVEDSVLEDMKKFEDSFKGIAERYRLLKRIGEGCSYLLSSCWTGDSKLTGLRYFFNCVQS